MKIEDLDYLTAFGEPVLALWWIKASFLLRKMILFSFFTPSKFHFDS
jgi:hypothetical protein